MTREEAKKLLPIIQAFAEGKTIQYEASDGWIDLDALYPHSDILSKYRIKPEIKYRPFKSMKECLTEMLRHSDIGYIRYKSDGKKEPIKVGPSDIDYIDYKYRRGCCDYDIAFGMFTFTDGEPFGIKEE